MIFAAANRPEPPARDPHRRQAMGEAGRKRVREQFTRTLMAERHIALYQRVLAGRAPYGAA